MAVSGQQLVDQVSALLKQLGIECWANHGQIPLRHLYPSAAPGDHLEIDLVGRIKDCGLLIEITSLSAGNRARIKRFLDHCDYFTQSPQPLRKRLRLFAGLPATKRSAFEDVDTWKCLYFGTGSELIEERIEPGKFIKAKDRLFIFNNDQLDYLLGLARLIGSWAKYELLSAIQFPPEKLEEESAITKKCIILKSRLVSTTGTQKCDLALLTLPAKVLLKIGRVFRYGGLTMPLEHTGGAAPYQRLLITDKLTNIAKFIGKDPQRCFPNTVTLAARQDQIEILADNKIRIPLNYASVDIVDGQHRVLAYARRGVRERVRNEANVPATLLILRTQDRKRANKLAARIFWEINSQQTRVKRDLLYLIKYDVLGDRDREAIAGEIIRQCNEGKKTLAGLFRTHPLRKKNKVGGTPIPVVTIVDELAALLRSDGQGLPAGEFKALFQFAPEEAERRHRELVRKGREIVERYFSVVKDTFEEDWATGPRSALFSSKYIAAFLRLLRSSFLSRPFNEGEIKRGLVRLRGKLRKGGVPAGTLSFPRGSDEVPSTKEPVKSIHGFLANKLGQVFEDDR